MAFGSAMPTQVNQIAKRCSRTTGFMGFTPSSAHAADCRRHKPMNVGRTGRSAKGPRGIHEYRLAVCYGWMKCNGPKANCRRTSGVCCVEFPWVGYACSARIMAVHGVTRLRLQPMAASGKRLFRAGKPALPHIVAKRGRGV
jgi:hypothetical protein